MKSLPEGCYSAVVFPEEQSIVISRTTDGPPYVCDEILTYKLEYQDAKLVWVQKPTCKPNFANRVKKLEPMLMYCQPKNRLLCLATSDGFPDLWRFSGDGLEIAGGQLTDMPSASTGEKTSGVVNVNISPDGKLVSVVRRIMVRDIPPADKKGNCYLDVWEIESGKKVYSKTVESVGFPVACFVNDQQLMVHWNNVLTTVDLLGKAEISSMHVQLPVLGVSISPISNRKMLYVSNYRGKGFQYSILSY